MESEVILPAIKGINLTGGIHITGSALADYELKEVSFPGGNIQQIETAINTFLKTRFEIRTPLSSLSVDDPIRQPSPVLAPTERIEGTELITTQMFVEVHIFSLTPVRYTITCSDEPIRSGWWVDDDKGD